MATALALVDNGTGVDAYRQSTDAASICKDIVVSTAMEIQKRKYVKVEGWQAIAIAHGCTASARDVERVEGGVRAIGEVRRMSDGAVIAEAEGFVGEDEPTWYGGAIRKWKWGQQKGEKVWYDDTLQKRPDYAIRAMAQTRAISRACRSAFAHVVVLMDAGLSTTPAEEVPAGGFDNTDFEEVRDDRTAKTMQQKAEEVPADFDAGAAGFDVEAMFKAAKDKAQLDQAWHDSKGLRARIKKVDEHIHTALVKTFGTVAEGFKNPQTDPILADEIPY